MKGPKPRSKPKAQIRAQLGFQRGGFPINSPLPPCFKRLEIPSLKERESEDCIHRDCTQFKSIEFYKNSIFVICDYNYVSFMFVPFSASSLTLSLFPSSFIYPLALAPISSIYNEQRRRIVWPAVAFILLSCALITAHMTSNY